MTTTSWVAAIDKKEHKNWVMVGCALNIAKNGIAPLIQRKMEAWYQSLISSPPLQSLPPCACAAGSPKCSTCVKWEAEIKRHHKSGRPKIFWDNSDRNQWGSQTGTWEIAKIFMPTLGTRTTHVVDAETTDIGGLLNLLEWCPFINPPVSRTVLTSARDQCRNHWAHAPKQELQDADVNTIFGHLNSLLNDPVFSSDKDAQKSSKELQDLIRDGLVNVRDSEVEALNLLRQSLVAELTKFRDDLDDVQVKVAQLNNRVGEVQRDLLEVKEQGDLNREETVKLRENVRTEVHTAKEEPERCQEDLSRFEDKVAQLYVEMSRIHESAKEDGNLTRAESAKLKQQLQTEVKEVEADLNEKVSTILNTVEDFNILLCERDDLRGVCDLISEDVEYLKRRVQNVDIELATAKSQVATLEINLSNVNFQVQGLANEVATNKNTISGLQKNVLEVKAEVETLKATPVQKLNSADATDVLFTTPSRLTAFTGRDSALAWLEQNLTPRQRGENCPGTSCCTKTICGLGGCGKTSLAVEFAWKCKNCFPGGVFWINGESDENINKSVVENLALLNISASTSEKVEDTLNRFSAFLSKKKHPWLLVVDNADELEDKSCPTGVKKICKGPWQRNGSVSTLGHILLTTRQTVKETKTFFINLSPDDCLELQCFSEKEGASFLMQRTGVQGKDLDQEAINLVNELGALPLALEQAAAYISALPIPCSFKAYLEKYRAVKLRLLEQQPVTAQTNEAQYRLSVLTTWRMNFEFVRNKSPAAATMMHIAAFLESEKVPIDVINPGLPELEQVDLRESARSEIDIAAILKVLSRNSLFSVDQPSRVFGTHKLVQEVVRESLITLTRIETMVAATRVLHLALKRTIDMHWSPEHAKPVNSFNLSEMNDQARNVLIALLLNFRKLKNHIEETNLSKEDGIPTLFNEHTLSLCTFACDLSENNLSLILLHAEVSEFRLHVAKMVRGDGDPGFLLNTMVSTIIAKRNCLTPGCHNESEKLAKETVQKMAYFEKSGCTISNHTKYVVLKQDASYYALAGQWEKNYKALLELERLPLCKADIVDLQMLVARAERFVSSGNFQAALERYKRALQLAREIYPSGDPNLWMILQHITMFLYDTDMIAEAKLYAEELLDIAKKCPVDSWQYFAGMTSALSVLKEFDVSIAECRFFAILNERWPQIYKGAIEGCVELSSVINEDDSNFHAVGVLQGLLGCFSVITRSLTSKCAERKFATEKGEVYLRIAQILLSIQKNFYGEEHPGLKPTYKYLIRVHRLLENMKEVTEFSALLNQCEQEAPTQFYRSVPGHCNVPTPSILKDRAKNFYLSGNYADALDLYTQMLRLSPDDAKLFTNRCATYMKWSQQPENSPSAQIMITALALQDSQNAITADPSWVKGYYWKAVCLAHLGERSPSLAAAAVAQHLFPLQCAKIPAVEDRFGSCNAEVVTTVQELLRATHKRDTRNLVIVVKEGRYELSNPVKLQDNTVLVGLGETQIICSQGIPLKVNETVYMENITLSPSVESVSVLKEKAKEYFNRGQVDEALSLYKEALNSCPNDPQILTSRALTYLTCTKKKKVIPSERVSSLELALNDAEAAIKANPVWLLGYYFKAVSLAELDRKQQALAAAAVFKHLSLGRDVPEVTQRYGDLQIEVVQSSVELRSVLQQGKSPDGDGVNEVVLVKEGDYFLERTVEIPQPIVVAGQGSVKVSCKFGKPFHFAQAGYIENIQMFDNCYSQ